MCVSFVSAGRNGRSVVEVVVLWSGRRVVESVMVGQVGRGWSSQRDVGRVGRSAGELVVALSSQS